MSPDTSVHASMVSNRMSTPPRCRARRPAGADDAVACRKVKVNSVRPVGCWLPLDAGVLLDAGVPLCRSMSVCHTMLVRHAVLECHAVPWRCHGGAKVVP
ncbi:hypothetical protein [Streptomyces sp. NPDC020742]|uniref:hypothetical protein n=1 Tax=Streptomyces sp. NPDC020742 TaxID=3154897 RepID=UPI0033E5C344